MGDRLEEDFANAVARVLSNSGALDDHIDIFEEGDSEPDEEGDSEPVTASSGVDQHQLLQKLMVPEPTPTTHVTVPTATPTPTTEMPHQSTTTQMRPNYQDVPQLLAPHWRPRLSFSEQAAANVAWRLGKECYLLHVPTQINTLLPAPYQPR